MSMRLLELERVAHEVCDPWGIQVVVHDGWATRGYDFLVRPDGALRHWTVGPRTGVFPSGNVLLFGRKGANPLPGPLSQLGQDRGGGPGGWDRIHLLAAGKANHAGFGEWNGIGPGGNSLTVGMEIEWSGPGEAFSRERKFVSELGMLILMRVTAGDDPNDACEHREWALPDGRKIDTNLDGDELRRFIATGRHTWAPGPQPTPAPNPAPAPQPGEEEDDDMDLICYSPDDPRLPNPRWWVLGARTKRYESSPAEAAVLVFTKQAQWGANGGPIPLPWATIKEVPVDVSDPIFGPFGIEPAWRPSIDVDEAALAGALAELPPVELDEVALATSLSAVLLARPELWPGLTDDDVPGIVAGVAFATADVLADRLGGAAGDQPGEVEP